MIPSQTLQVLSGVAVALFYTGAATAIGCLALTVIQKRDATGTIQGWLGLSGYLWLAFVLGQGVLGIAWLVSSMAGALNAPLVWSVCVLGWIYGTIESLSVWHQVKHATRQTYAIFRLSCRYRSWYLWMAVGTVAAALLWGIIVLAPPDNYDAAVWYLTVAKVIAYTHKLALQPFVIPHTGLFPLQVEMHWAALFTITNETAVTVWDYFCALSFLYGMGLLAWSLTSSRRVVLLTVVMMFSSSGFYNLIGVAKTDIAAAQYGIAAFLWLTLHPILGRKAIIGAGLCAGWGMAGRYTNVIIVPGLIAFLLGVAYQNWKTSKAEATRSLRPLMSDLFVAALAAALAGMPMLFKNWLLVGCPLAPFVGCHETFWANITDTWSQNISLSELLFYPFVWTFKHLEDSWGNISPLFIGFLPFLVIGRRSSLAGTLGIAGLAGLVSLTTWLLIKPTVLYTRWLLVPLVLFAIPLSASLVTAERRLEDSPFTRGMIRTAIFIVLAFLLVKSRAGVVDGFKYLTSVENRDARYATSASSSYDVIVWLNANVRPGQRVALNNWRMYKYLLDPRILLTSESADEFQWLHENRSSLSPSKLWHFYAQNGFTYFIAARKQLNSVQLLSRDDLEIKVAYAGVDDAVLSITRH